jgi:uncharacterized protein YjbI with pentapeptide repeats
MSELWDKVKDLSGFWGYTDPNGKYYRGKTLWDLLKLLIVPTILVFAAWWLSNASSAIEARATNEKLYEDRLVAYLDRMERYLLEKNLISANIQSGADPPNQGNSVLYMAQVQTVTALRFLNTSRQNAVFQFLRDTGLSDFLLVGASMRGVNLNHTDMGRLVLSGSDFTNAKLNGSSLWRADLTDAYLWGTNFAGASFWRADLAKANLTRADLSGADLSEANLSEANLSEADLSGAILENAKGITEEQLREVKSLQGAIMPDGSTHK